MKPVVKGVLWTVGILFGIVVLLLPPGVAPLLTGVRHLAVGWIPHAIQVFPQVTVNGSGVGMLAVCLALAGAIGHRFCAWLWKGSGHVEPWRPRWTAAGLGALVLMFAAGMAFTAVAHQTAWLLTSKEPLTAMESNARNAPLWLKSIAAAQAEYRSNDRDGNKVHDYWRDDVEGLYILEVQGAPIQLIDKSVALADTRGLTGKAPFGWNLPKDGYYFRALKFQGETSPDPQRYAVCAYPAHPRLGAWVFVVSEKNVLYRKPWAWGDKPPEAYPDDPLKEGWSKLE